MRKKNVGMIPDTSNPNILRCVPTRVLDFVMRQKQKMHKAEDIAHLKPDLELHQNTHHTVKQDVLAHLHAGIHKCIKCLLDIMYCVLLYQRYRKGLHNNFLVLS